MMDLDEFFEQDIPVFLDGYEDQKTNIASETEINSLLSSGEAALTSTLSATDLAAGDILTNQPLTIQTNNITIQTNNGPETIISPDEDVSTPQEEQSTPDSLSPLEEELLEKEPPKPKFNEELVRQATNVSDADERALYLQALRYLDSKDVRDAVSLLYGLLQKHPNYLAYKTRLFDALRLSEDFSDIPLPKSEASPRTATSSLVANDSFTEQSDSSQATSEKSDSTSAYGLYAKAVAFIKEKNYNQAALVLEQLAQSFPDNIAIQVRLEQVRAKKGELYD